MTNTPLLRTSATVRPGPTYLKDIKSCPRCGLERKARDFTDMCRSCIYDLSKTDAGRTPDWTAAACAEIPGDTRAAWDLFVPERNGRTNAELAYIARAAKEYCAACPIAAECLDYALREQMVGVWGGTTTDERKIIRRNRKAGVA